jgi:phage tail-like protein
MFSASTRALAAVPVKRASAHGLPKALPKGMPVTGQLKSQQFGVTMRFDVELDDCPLGQWSQCDGLRVTFNTEKVPDGGNYDHQVNLPLDIQYDHIKLRRAMTKKDSAMVSKWLNKVRKEWINYGPDEAPYRSRGGSITLFDVTGQELCEWELYNVHPISWSGPSLSAQQAGIAMEELVIEHEGFL